MIRDDRRGDRSAHHGMTQMLEPLSPPPLVAVTVTSLPEEFGGRSKQTSAWVSLVWLIVVFRMIPFNSTTTEIGPGLRVVTTMQFVCPDCRPPEAVI